MFRLFFLMIAVIFGYMLWRIVRVVSRSGGGTSGDDPFVEKRNDSPPARTYRDIRDAEFRDVKPPPPDETSGPRESGS